MADETNGSGDIRYTTKEVLARIEGKIDVMAAQLQQKADVAHVTAATARIEQLEKDMQEGKETVKTMLIPQFHDMVSRVQDLEKDSVSNTAISTYKRWLTVVAIPALLGAIWTVIEVVRVVSGGRVVP